MCGICGIASLDDGHSIDREELADMNATLRHRGPDSAGSFVEGPVGLAMRRLSIIDLEGGDQPIYNEDQSVVVVQNGEIYNYRELRERLLRAGHRLATSSDTEVLVHLYEDLGPNFVTELRGMFAVALWDSRRRRLVLARDRFGIKPLYYRLAGRLLSFASELKALVRQPEFSREVDLDALEAFLALGWIPTPLTIFREARKLPPGHLAIVEGGRMTLRRFARERPAAASELSSASFDELAVELRDRLRDSVRAHLVADVPVGVLLSGGVDSSTVVALAAEAAPGRLKTFSIGFEERSFNELSKARAVAERYDTEHHELVLRPNAVELLPRLVETFDEPFADSSALPTYLVSELAAQEVKVALAGEGGDELFGGYFTYVADRIAPWAAPLAATLRPALERLPSSSGATRLDDKAKRFARGAGLAPLERHCSWGTVFSAAAREELLRPSARGRRDPLDGYRERYAETDGAEELARMLDVDLGINLVDDQLVKTDRASMAHSLETRVPLLDTAVSELALSTPASHKVRGLSKKRLLRAAASPLLPREVLRGRKQGFSIPAAAWLRGELEPLLRDVLSPAAVRAQGYFEPEAVTGLIDAHSARRADHSRQLWSLLMFTLWHERTATPAADQSQALGATRHVSDG